MARRGSFTNSRVRAGLGFRDRPGGIEGYGGVGEARSPLRRHPGVPRRRPVLGHSARRVPAARIDVAPRGSPDARPRLQPRAHRGVAPRWGRRRSRPARERRPTREPLVGPRCRGSRGSPASRAGRSSPPPRRDTGGHHIQGRREAYPLHFPDPGRNHDHICLPQRGRPQALIRRGRIDDPHRTVVVPSHGALRRGGSLGASTTSTPSRGHPSSQIAADPWGSASTARRPRAACFTLCYHRSV
jgi:hypothetical protein